MRVPFPPHSQVASVGLGLRDIFSSNHWKLLSLCASQQDWSEAKHHCVELETPSFGENDGSLDPLRACISLSAPYQGPSAQLPVTERVSKHNRNLDFSKCLIFSFIYLDYSFFVNLPLECGGWRPRKHLVFLNRVLSVPSLSFYRFSTKMKHTHCLLLC